MVDWQVTATTIFCDAIGDEVTVMVYQDWSVKCTGQQKYGESGKKSAAPKSRLAKVKCTGTGCSCIAQYKQKLLSEESK
jgi:hypothetical protein